MYMFTFSGVFLINLNLGSGFPDSDLCSLGQDNPMIAAYCQKLGLNFVSNLFRGASINCE